MTLVTALPAELAANFAPALFELRLIVVAVVLVVAFPALSSSATVKAVVADVLAVAVKAAEVIASLLAAPNATAADLEALVAVHDCQIAVTVYEYVPGDRPESVQVSAVEAVVKELGQSPLTAPPTWVT